MTVVAAAEGPCLQLLSVLPAGWAQGDCLGILGISVGNICWEYLLGILLGISVGHLGLLYAEVADVGAGP